MKTTNLNPDVERLSNAKSNINAVEIISCYVDIRRVGRQYRGLCPFHAEKTPSFFVSEEKGFYCFGCQAKGDVITFIQKIEGVGFREAIARLGIDSGDYKRKPVDIGKQRAAAMLAGWMNEQHLKIGALLRELSLQIAIAHEAKAMTLVELFEREFSIFEVFFDDLARPEFAPKLWAVRDTIEQITRTAPVEPLEVFPPLTSEYRRYLMELAV